MKKILIANRGEIAVRIIRACREMDLETVAVYSVADRLALHVRLADESYCIGPAPSTESYLNMTRLLAVCHESGADAVHPGYGFLSENAHFARLCREHGIIFIGPGPEAIEKMGNKTAGRQTMIDHGVRVVPGSQEPITSIPKAQQLAADIGYPVLVKAAGGGGGKGMRLVHDPAELVKSIAAAQREAQNAFNNPDVYLEKFIEHPRHIEIQVLADHKGHTIHLGERECSIQRRHQKLIEESPSPFVTAEMRAEMGAAAIAAARAVDYVSAGTVEFIVDSDRNFYFLEMNTRLQVEHPVTELVTGVDLVKEQLRIAAGEELGFSQADIIQDGHAIECRISAEDPFNNFLPAVGVIKSMKEPGGPGIRIDSGVYSGYEIPIHYDPMFAKLIVKGANRREAIKRMIRALKEYKIAGLVTNIPFHLRVLNDDHFKAGNFDTTYVNHLSLDTLRDTGLDQHVVLMAALEKLRNEPRNAIRLSSSTRPARHFSSWRQATI